MEISIGKEELTSGEDTTITVHAIHQDKQEFNITNQADYAINPVDIISINNGIITANKPGKATIRISVFGMTEEINVKVYPDVLTDIFAPKVVNTETVLITGKTTPESTVKITGGKEEVRIAVNNETGQFEAEIPLNQNEINKLKISAVADEVESSAVEIIVLHDNMQPSLPVIEMNPTGWTNAASITVEIIDGDDEENGSGVDRTEYRIGEDSNWKTYELPVEVTHGDAKIIYARTIDKAGNKSGLTEAPIKIDREGPKVTFEPNGNNVVGKEAATKVTVTDDESGIDASSLEYVWSTGEKTPDEQDWKSFTNGENLTQSMNHHSLFLHVRGLDNAGNITAVHSNAFNRQSGNKGGSGSIPSQDATAKNIKMLININNIIDFEPNRFVYSLETEEEEVELVIETSHAKAITKVNDHVVKEKVTKFLEEGENVFEIVIIAENGNEQTYLLTINRLQTVPFPDIKDHWAEEYIKEAYRNGWLKGYPNGDFGPEDNVTRIQAASLFVRILELTERSAVSFTDIQGVEDETVEELELAYANGIVNGFPDQKFKPYQAVTRAQLALMIYRSYEKMTGTFYEPKQPANFPDITHNDEETQNAIAMLVELGIAEGSEGKFLPNDDTTRAHVAKMLVNYDEVLTGFSDID